MSFDGGGVMPYLILLGGFMKKKLALLILLAILVGSGYYYMFSYSASQSIHTLGPNGDLAGMEKLDSSAIYEYCFKNDITPSDIEVFEASYSVFNFGNNDPAIPLPILNPTSIKNILGVYSSIPLIEQKSNDINPYNLIIDPAWLKDQPQGFLSEPLIIRYIYQISDINMLPDHLSIDSLSSKQLRTDTRLRKELQSSVALSDQIKAELPLEDQNDLKALVTAYVKWIGQNISYPADESLESAEKYIRLRAPDKTLSYKVGVCLDSADLLIALLNSQGIDAYLSKGINIDKFAFENIYPNNYIRHATVCIKTPQGLIQVDPTIQNTEITKKIKLDDGTTLLVSKEAYSDTRAYPMFIENIDPIADLNKIKNLYGFKLQEIKRINH